MEEIYLLYGSQSGNAESIAKDMADILRNLCKDAAGSFYFKFSRTKILTRSF